MTGDLNEEGYSGIFREVNGIFSLVGLGEVRSVVINKAIVGKDLY